MFADHLESTFQPLLRQTDNENITPVDSGEDCAIVFVTPKEVKKEIDTNIKARKPLAVTYHWKNSERISKKSSS